MSKTRNEERPPVLPSSTELPWHVQARERVAAAVQAERLAHGLLIAGPAGVGKDLFAARLAAGLLCSAIPADLEPCGVCANCRLSFGGTHPDLYWIQALEGKKAIGIEPVRELCEQLAMTSMRGGRRVAILAPADALTINAQNALLKTLEEPAPGTLLVLLSARPSRVLATLRSRCQRVELPRPPFEQALAWLTGEVDGEADPRRLLELAAGAPLRAKALAPHARELDAQMHSLLVELARGRVPLTVLADPLVGEGLPARLDWLEQWLGQLARVRLAGATNVTNPAASALQGPVRAVNMPHALTLVDRIRDVRRLLDGSAQPQLAVEALLGDVAAVLRVQGGR